MSLDAQIGQLLEGLRASGPGSHVHLDDALDISIASDNAPEWISVARRVAEMAMLVDGRFIVVVPLEPLARIPSDAPPLDAALRLHPDEPPAVHYVAARDEPRTWIGEYYRRDLPGSAPSVLRYVSAYRAQDGVEADDGEFSTALHFEVR